MKSIHAFNECISPQAMPYVEELESATSANDLGHAYYEVSAEARRLSFGWPLLEFSTALGGISFLAIVMTVGRNPPLYFAIPAYCLCIATIFVKGAVERSPRGQALTRLGNALGRWMHLIPAMKESPDLIAKGKLS